MVRWRNLTCLVWLICQSAVVSTACAAEGQAATDSRDGTLVTHQVDAEPVIDLLKTLSKRSTIRLEAERELGERRVHVFVQDLPEARLRKSLAQVTHGIWTKRQQGRLLRLEPDPSAIREQHALVERRRTKFFAGLRTLCSQLALDRMAAERLVKSGNASAGYLLEPANRAAVQLTALLGDQEWRQMETTGHLRVMPEQLGALGPKALRDYTIYLNQAQKEAFRLAPPGFTPPPPLDLDETSRSPLEFRVIPEANGAPYGFLSVGLAGTSGAAGMTISGSLPGKNVESRWGGTVRGGSQTEAPSQLRSVRFRRPPTDWGGALRVLADALRLQIVSEEYTRLPRPMPQLNGELVGSIPELIDQLCSAFGYEWRLRDGVYQFRSTTWYLDRAQEPPGTLVKAAQLARERKKPLSLDWLVLAAGTSPERRPRLWIHAPQAQAVVLRYRPLLQFYGVLTSQQRATLANSPGLGPEALSLNQQSALLAVLPSVAKEWPSEKAARTRVRMSQTSDQARFTFTADGSSVEASISLPMLLGAPGPGFGGIGAPPSPGIGRGAGTVLPDKER